jgi:26S proteasome regulatory subunit N11
VPSRSVGLLVSCFTGPPADPSSCYHLQEMLSLAEAYTASVKEESTMTPQQLATRHVGKRDPKRHLEDAVEKAMGGVVVQSLGMGVLGEL